MMPKIPAPTCFGENAFTRYEGYTAEQVLAIQHEAYRAGMEAKSTVWRDVVLHAVAELEELDDETAQHQAADLRALLEVK